MNRSMPDIARLVATSTSPEDLLRRAATALRAVVPVDGWCGLTLDPATLTKTGGVHESVLPEAALSRVLALEYGERDVNRFADLARQPSPVAVLYDATEGRLESSPRFREVMAPGGYQHELRLVLREPGRGPAGGRVWGGFTLLRTGRGRPFSRADRRLLAGLSGPLAVGLRRAVVRADTGAVSGQPVASGLVLFDQQNRVSSITRDARRLLGARDGGPLPLALQAVAAQARGPAGSGSVRAWSPAGGWLTLAGWRLAAGQVAVSVETIRSEHLSALVLDAYALSVREREVTELVLHGFSTSEIADRLFLSPYTVQDHLRSVFGKLGVRSRRALVAELLLRRRPTDPVADR